MKGGGRSLSSPTSHPTSTLTHIHSFLLHAEYETVTPEGDDEEKGDASALRNSDNDNDGAEIYPDSEDYLYEGDEEREGGGGGGGGRDLGSDHEFDSNTVEQEVRDDMHEDGGQEGSGDDATLL